MAEELPNIELQRTAAALYVVYRAVNHLRHRKPESSQYISHLMDQLLHEATRDSPGFRRTCAGLPEASRVRKRRRA